MRYPMARLRAAMEHSTRLPLTTHGDSHLRSTANSVSKRQQQMPGSKRPDLPVMPSSQGCRNLEAMLQEAEFYFHRLDELLLPMPAAD